MSNIKIKINFFVNYGIGSNLFLVCVLLNTMIPTAEKWMNICLTHTYTKNNNNNSWYCCGLPANNATKRYNHTGTTVVQLDGTILAQTSARAWGSAGLLQWLEFTKLTGIAVQGSGVINGRGQDWWTYADPNDADDESVEMLLPQTKPTVSMHCSTALLTHACISVIACKIKKT